MEVFVPIGEFKTHCYQLLSSNKNGNNDLIITRRGEPIAKVTAINKKYEPFFGSLSSVAEIKGDIISPTGEKWDAESE